MGKKSYNYLYTEIYIQRTDYFKIRVGMERNKWVHTVVTPTVLAEK